MPLALHPNINIQKLSIGRELAPLLVIDNLLTDPDELVAIAAGKIFGNVANYYPGVRAKAPLTFQRFIVEKLGALFAGHFQLGGRSLRFTECNFSIVTTPPERLTVQQRTPHADSYSSSELAFIYYLFKQDLGGTAFYRHRSTGFETLDPGRAPRYTQEITAERQGPHAPAAEYINGDSALYEQVGRQDGVFNRMLVYRRNSLHSGCIGRDFVFDPDPQTGRLSINGFLA